MSLPELDLKKDEKSKLILSVAQKLKLAKKPWDDFAKLYHKYSQALLAVTAIGKQVTEQLNTIGALHKGDVGENITRLSGVQAAIDQKLEAISNCIEIELVTPIQNSLAPDQQSVANFEKEFVKNSENIGSQLKKIEAQTKKVGKKGNNDDLMTVMSQFKNKITELDNWKSDSLKRVFLLERKRFCELLSHCCKVSQAELDLAHTISTYDTLLPQWNATVATAEVLPDELLKKFTTQGGLMQLTTAESASVQLANTTDQRIQMMQRGGVNEFAPPSDLPPPPPGSGGSYDAYEQPSSSYDSGDYSNGHSNDYASTDYYEAPDDVPPPPMNMPPPPPMSSPPPPPVKKTGPPSGPPSFSPRTPRESMPPNSMPPPPPVKKMAPPPPMNNPPPPTFNAPKVTPRASQQMSPSPPKYAPPPPNVKAAPPPPMNTPPPPPMNRVPSMPPKAAGGPPTPPSIPKSAGGAPPPPPPAPKAPGPPPPPPVSSSSKKSKAKDDDDDDHHSGGGERNALLSSIHNFKKGGLKKAQTNDRSGPNLTQPKGGGGAGMRGGMPPMF